MGGPVPEFFNPLEDAGLFQGSDAGTASVGSFITGATTQADGVASSQTVFVFSRNGWSLRLVARIQSDASGLWQLNGLREGNYYMAMIQDRTRTLNAAVLDWMVAATPPP